VTLDARTIGVNAVIEEEVAFRARVRSYGELEHPRERHRDLCHLADVVAGDTTSVEALPRMVATTAIRRPSKQESSVLDLH
jgi:hypothetical protein